MREEVLNWRRQAERDLESARHCFKSGDYYLCAFMCHQCVEKGLNALVMKTQRASFVPTHSLVRLGRDAKVPEELLTELRILTPEYTASRYPDAANGLP